MGIQLSPAQSPIPVTLVTGFLGSGKTTLLNHILNAQTGRKFAIIENEFGATGVDGSFVNAPRDVLFELNNGCLCCTVRSDLIDVFEQLAQRSGEFDHVIIETTGLAAPEPVMRIFEQASLRSRFALEGVVTVVDASHIEASLIEVGTCEEQITYADLLVLNKTDSLAYKQLEAIETRLRTLNPLAKIVRTQHAKVDVQNVLNIDRCLPDESVPTHSPYHHRGHQHDQSIVSVSVAVDGEVDIEQLDQWLGHLTRRRDLRVLRMKGVLAIPGQKRRFVFHGVRDVIDVRPDRFWDTAHRQSHIVLIGRGLEKANLQDDFSACTQPGLSRVQG